MSEVNEYDDQRFHSGGGASYGEVYRVNRVFAKKDPKPRKRQISKEEADEIILRNSALVF